jgi:sporulation protein YunB
MALVALGIAALVFLFMLFIVERNLKPTIKEIGEAKARQIATEAVNNAVKYKIADSVNYHDLVVVQKDSQGRVVLMQPNIVRINQLASDTTLSINDALKDLANEKFSIPLGRTSAPGCDEPTSRCQTSPSMWTLGGDKPVIPGVAFIR